jgi:hypothetical protein
MRRLALGLVWISVAAAAGGFFLPWATVTIPGAELAALAEAIPGGDVTLEIRRNGRAARASLSDVIGAPRTVRGVDIPWLARQEEAAVASALLGVFTNSRHDLAANGVLVVLVPVVAGIAGVFLTVGRRAMGPAAIALLCAAAAGLGLAKVSALERMEPLAITIGEGALLSILAYGGLAVAAGWLSVLNRQRRREA